MDFSKAKIAAVFFTPGTFHSEWKIISKEQAEEQKHTGTTHFAIPIESDGIVVNTNKDGDIVGTKYSGREYAEPYWVGDEREGGGYRHALVRNIGDAQYAIF